MSCTLCARGNRILVDDPSQPLRHVLTLDHRPMVQDRYLIQ